MRLLIPLLLVVSCGPPEPPPPPVQEGEFSCPDLKKGMTREEVLETCGRPCTKIWTPYEKAIVVFKYCRFGCQPGCFASRAITFHNEKVNEYYPMVPVYEEPF